MKVSIPPEDECGRSLAERIVQRPVTLQLRPPPEWSELAEEIATEGESQRALAERIATRGATLGKIMNDDAVRKGGLPLLIKGNYITQDEKKKTWWPK